LSDDSEEPAPQAKKAQQTPSGAVQDIMNKISGQTSNERRLNNRAYSEYSQGNINSSMQVDGLKLNESVNSIKQMITTPEMDKKLKTEKEGQKKLN
jgi:hypothetical protein